MAQLSGSRIALRIIELTSLLTIMLATEIIATGGIITPFSPYAKLVLPLAMYVVHLLPRESVRLISR